MTCSILEPSKGVVRNQGLLAPRGRLWPLAALKQERSLSVDLWVMCGTVGITAHREYCTSWWWFQQEHLLRDNEGGLRMWGGRGVELPLGLRLSDPISLVLPEPTQKTLLSSYPGGASLGLLVPQPQSCFS